MSLSKEVMGAGTEQPSPPQRKCNRCRHHGIIVPLKGHRDQCPFTECPCWRCHQITQRQRAAAVPRKGKKKVRHGGEQRPRITSAVGAVKQAAEAAECSTGGTVERAGASVSTGGDMTGVDRKEAPCTPSAVYFGVFGHIPVIPLPLGLSADHPRGYVPCVAPVFNMPWFPVPAGLHGALMLPHLQSGSVAYPPPPEHGPPAESGQCFSALLPRPHRKDAEHDVEQVD